MVLAVKPAFLWLMQALKRRIMPRSWSDRHPARNCSVSRPAPSAIAEEWRSDERQVLLQLIDDALVGGREVEPLGKGTFAVGRRRSLPVLLDIKVSSRA